MKRILKIFIIILTTKVLYAQQVPMYSHYFYKPMVYNPAYTGTNEAPNVMLLNHTQWVGIKGAPQYNILTFDGSFKNKHAGLGVVITSDRRGVNNRIGGNLSYSYKLLLAKKMHLMLGVSAGVINQTIDLSNAVIETSNDPSLFTNSQQKTSFDANAGIAYVWDKFEFGFAMPQLANNRLAYTSSMDTRTYYTQTRHYMGSLKYKFLLSKEKNISITPLALVRFVPNAPFQYDASLNFNLKDKFWIGGTYKSNYAVGAIAGVTLFKRLSVGYSYDFITGSIGKYAGLSHEIMLNFKFIKPKKEVLDTSSLAQDDDEDFKTYFSSHNLNNLITQNLIKKIEVLLDRGNATPDEVHKLQEEIADFLNSELSDKESQKTLKQYYNTLNKSQEEITVLVKGAIVLGHNNTSDSYSKITIKVTDLETHQHIATCKPNTKTGTYFLILKPGKKYAIEAEGEGFNTYLKDFNPKNSSSSYETSLEIFLK